MRPQKGTRLGSRYELTGRIAVGGMGEVWRGKDTVLDREVAAKIMKEEYRTEPGFLARFKSEARSMGSVSHPGIAAVYDYGEEDGAPYLVMEYVPGEALSTILERNGGLPEGDALEIVAQAAEALNAAHNAGVVHRDIKPGNLLITPDFKVKITDFGIARVADQAPLTKTGQVMGTAQYLAPEQATGKGSRPQSDLYSLGVILYEALAGVRPFTGESQVEIAIAQVNRKHPPLPQSVSEPVRRLVDATLSKKPEGRPESGKALATAARALIAGDVAAAEAAVPQMNPRPETASEAVTRVFNQPAPTQATQVLPQTAVNPVVEDPEAGTSDVEEPQKKSKGAAIAIVVLSILAIAAIAWAVWQFAKTDEEPNPEATATATPTEENKTVTINPDDYVGQTATTAERNLENLGLKVKHVDVESSEPSGRVVSVREGNQGYTFEEGDTVTIEVSTGPSEPEPKPEPTQKQKPKPTKQAPGDGSDSGDDNSGDDGSGDGDGSGGVDSTDPGGGQDEGGSGNSGDSGDGNGSGGNDNAPKPEKTAGGN
ncbi:protein kinase [Brevibacterium sp. UMB1308A]|uniref:protein kinase domain-containing protein n=1 Tax=Brevibacterium sp. UMB1308A TaxID=3050608 RepID=UPI00254FAAD5|nr:protein kinase [Brevibacterium sp. UMB1308A]MDK8346729.1 protein kinase [Brevibacterium sp. UMB1308B]MDK8714069.1 protein kinase [Brevibacterium sp. UMB1308A]